MRIIDWMRCKPKAPGKELWIELRIGKAVIKRAPATFYLTLPHDSIQLGSSKENVIINVWEQ